jgi:hypothetical protein
MFSAIGNMIWGGKAEEEEQTDSQINDLTSNSSSTEVSTQTSDNKSASTQVNLDESRNNENKNTLNDTVNSQNQLDWVIVEDADGMSNDKACQNENLVEMTNSETNEPIKETIDDPLIGSFFQKNEFCDDEERYKFYREHQNDNKIEVDMKTDNQICTVETQTVLPQPKQDTWLITPLPCLTSITESSQQAKSMIDNDPLENLLIEQPNRFMSASTTEALPHTNNVTKYNTPNKRQPKKLRVKKTYAEVMQLNPDDAVFIKDLFKEEEQVLVKEPATPVIVKRTSEKRKEAEKSSPVSPVLNESPKKISRKSGKSLKTKASAQNKENMQVKTLLMAECFPKYDTQHKNTHNRYGQMLRANKNAALFSMSGNTRQRKFHNLQQPSMTMQKTNQKI